MNEDIEPITHKPSWLVPIRKRDLILIVILVISLFFAYILRFQFSRAFVQLGNTATLAGNDGFAEISYNLAVILNTDLKESTDQCIADKNQGQYELAISHCSKVINIDPNFALAYFNRGLAYMILKDYDRAIADFSKDIEILPNATRSFINRGTIYMYQQKYDLAIIEFNKSIEINPKEPQVWLNRGLVYIQESNNDLAISDCNKAIELEERYWNAYYCLGLAFSNQGKYESAIANFEKAISLSPSTRASVIYCMQGVTYTKMDNFESAITSFEQGIKLDNTEENGWCKLAWENARQGIPTP